MRWWMPQMGKNVVSRFETEEFRQILDVVHQWYQDGILNPGNFGIFR